MMSPPKSLNGTERRRLATTLPRDLAGTVGRIALTQGDKKVLLPLLQTIMGALGAVRLFAQSLLHRSLRPPSEFIEITAADTRAFYYLLDRLSA